MSDFEDVTRQIIGPPPDGYEWQPWRPPLIAGSAYVSSGDRTCMFKAVPLWVPPKGVFKPGWITRDEGSKDCWWHNRDVEYDTKYALWDKDYSSRMACIIPDNLPPLTIPAHLCKFRVGD